MLVCLESVCVHVSPGSLESHLPHPAFPLRFLLFKQRVVLNCHQGSQNCVFALDWGAGGGEGANDTISLLPGQSGPGAKGKGQGGLPPLVGQRTAPPATFTWAEPTERRGKVSNLGARGSPV